MKRLSAPDVDGLDPMDEVPHALQTSPIHLGIIDDREAESSRGQHKMGVQVVASSYEEALALALDELPARAGFLTPSTGLGNALVTRLRKRGMELSVT